MSNMAESHIYKKNIEQNEEVNIWNLYLYAMKSPITKQKYQKRLEKIFDFVGIEGRTVASNWIRSNRIDKMQCKVNLHSFRHIYK